MNEIFLALISGGVTLVVCLINNNYQSSKTRSLMEYQISELTKHVEKHNGVIDRTYKLEKYAEVCDEKIKVINHRISDLEDTEKDKPQ